MRQYILIITGLIFASGCSDAPEKRDEYAPVAPEMTIGWNYADSVIKHILPPQIPPDTLYITDFADAGKNVRIQPAIDAAFEKGGGTVIIPKGTYYSGPLVLKSKVNLHLVRDAELNFIPDPVLFPNVLTWFRGIPCMNFSPMIYARNASNIAITGEGIINGSGNDPAWKNMKYYEDVDWELLKDLEDENIDPANRKFGQGHSLRPDLITFIECTNVKISGVQLLNTPLSAIHTIKSDNIELSNISVNSNGFDQTGLALESSEYVLVDSVSVRSVTDGIKILSGNVRIEDNKASRNIIIQNSEFTDLLNSAVSIGNACRGGANHIFLSGLDIDGAEEAFIVQADAELRGKIHDILIRNVRATNILDPFIQCNINHGSRRTRNPLLYNISIEQTVVDSCGRAFLIKGHSRNIIQNITFSGIIFHTFKGSYAEDIRNLEWIDVSENGKIISGTWDIGNTDTPEISLDDYEEEEKVLDSDDIDYSELPENVKTRLAENYTKIPIEDIDRIITRSNVIYEIDLETESTKDLQLLILNNGEIIRLESEITFEELPSEIVSALESYLKVKPVPFMMNEIEKIVLQDLTYYKLEGEHENKLFALGITEEGNIIEKKQKTITTYFSTEEKSVYE